MLVMKRKIWETIGNSIVVGELSRGCELCMKGEKLVLFITGLCGAKCFYCPLSEDRKNVDVMYANEVRIKSIKEAIKEAELMNANGTGITGGDPLMVLDRTLEAIKRLKEHFGYEHHIHLYTNAILLTLNNALKLKKSGLDELRIHPTREEDWAKVAIAKKAGLFVGIEIPVIPGEINILKRKLRLAEKLQVDFVNLNELEFTPSNSLNLRIRGFRLKKESLAAVEGSEEEALKIIRWAADRTNLNVHYCPSKLKDSVQFRNRIKRIAKKIAKKYEKVTDDGLLLKGVIEWNGNLDKLINKIKKKLNIPNDMIEINTKKYRIETSIELLKEILKMKLPTGARAFIVEEYPIKGRLEVTKLLIRRTQELNSFSESTN